MSVGRTPLSLLPPRLSAVFDEERQELHELVDGFVDACANGDAEAMVAARSRLRVLVKDLRSRAYRRAHG